MVQLNLDDAVVGLVTCDPSEVEGERVALLVRLLQAEEAYVAPSVARWVAAGRSVSVETNRADSVGERDQSSE